MVQSLFLWLVYLVLEKNTHTHTHTHKTHIKLIILEEVNPFWCFLHIKLTSILAIMELQSFH